MNNFLLFKFIFFMNYHFQCNFILISINNNWLTMHNIAGYNESREKQEFGKTIQNILLQIVG